MKEIDVVRRRLKERRIEVIRAPVPGVDAGSVQVRVASSLISSGTERTKAKLASVGLLRKARARPDAVKQVVGSFRQRGLRETWATISARINASEGLGYSCAGLVTAVGEGVEELRPGMRVACAGAGYALHAEVVAVPAMLVMPIADGVSFSSAAFVAPAGIAMQGLRQAGVEPGGGIAVIGLGLVGQLSLRIGTSLGFEMFGFDIQPSRAEIAVRHGARATASIDELKRSLSTTVAGGADAVVIAAATEEDEPMRLAGEIARDRGTVVLIGDVGTRFPREPYYRKELQIRLSRSYGPGRYDPSYEEEGVDYPLGYIRWTERRNMELFLSLVSRGALEVEDLISARHPIADAGAAYQHLISDPGLLAIALEYGQGDVSEIRVQDRPAEGAARSAEGHKGQGIAAIGAGNFATRVLFPAFRNAGAQLMAVSSDRGLSAVDAKEKFGFKKAVADLSDELGLDGVHAVLIATRHDTHADLVRKALDAGKHVFVEKPLCLHWNELDEIVRALNRAPDLVLCVGFNRRFAPATRWLLEQMHGAAGPRRVHIRVNAGALPTDHWLLDAAVGGGRLLGEGCHFVDLALGLVPSEVRTVVASGPDPLGNGGFVIHGLFEDGSMASIDYTTVGDPTTGKERIELFVGGMSGVIDDFRSWSVSRSGRVTRVRKGRQHKGHVEEIEGFLAAVQGEPEPASTVGDFIRSTAATLACADSLRIGRPVPVPEVRIES